MAIGIMGGTFNPVHIGHLMVAEFVREEYHLDKVLFIPSGNPPHKSKEKIAPCEMRKRLVEVAIETNPYFELDDMEIKRGGTTYTIDTIRQLSVEYPYEKLYFIIGTDTLFELQKWKDYREVAKNTEFILYGRGSKDPSHIERTMEILRRDHGFNINLSKGPEVELSSTNIRDRISKGLSIRYMVPDRVMEEIMKSNLY